MSDDSAVCSSCSLTDSSYKVVLEQLVGLEPSMKTTEEEESQAVLQRPLEICLKHSTVQTTNASACPLVRPQPGVAALHEYAEWITELNDKRGNSDGKAERVNLLRRRVDPVQTRRRNQEVL